MSEIDPLDDLASDLERWHRSLVVGSFEETFQALEAVVDRLERGRMTLDESLACYELGVRLAKQCAQILDEAELRVSRLEESLTSVEEWELKADPASAPIDDDQTG